MRTTRLRVFENSLLEKVAVLRREEVVGDRRKLYDEELCEMHSTPNTV
jgi:hypothetical protein